MKRLYSHFAMLCEILLVFAKCGFKGGAGEIPKPILDQVFPILELAFSKYTYKYPGFGSGVFDKVKLVSRTSLTPHWVFLMIRAFWPLETAPLHQFAPVQGLLMILMTLDFYLGSSSEQFGRGTRSGTRRPKL